MADLRLGRRDVVALALGVLGAACGSSSPNSGKRNGQRPLCRPGPGATRRGRKPISATSLAALFQGTLIATGLASHIALGRRQRVLW